MTHPVTLLPGRDGWGSAYMWCLHVVRVAALRAVVRAEMPQDFPDTVRGADGDRLAAVELGLVPVHLGQGEQLVGEEPGTGFGVDEPERQRGRDVHAGVGA